MLTISRHRISDVNLLRHRGIHDVSVSSTSRFSLLTSLSQLRANDVSGLAYVTGSVSQDGSALYLK